MQAIPSSEIELCSCGRIDYSFLVHLTLTAAWARVGTSPNYAIKSSAYSRQNIYKQSGGTTRVVTTKRPTQIAMTRMGFTISSLQKQSIKKITLLPDQDLRYIYFIERFLGTDLDFFIGRWTPRFSSVNSLLPKSTRTYHQCYYMERLFKVL